MLGLLEIFFFLCVIHHLVDSQNLEWSQQMTALGPDPV